MSASSRRKHTGHLVCTDSRDRVIYAGQPRARRTPDIEMQLVSWRSLDHTEQDDSPPLKSQHGSSQHSQCPKEPSGTAVHKHKHRHTERLEPSAASNSFQDLQLNY